MDQNAYRDDNDTGQESLSWNRTISLSGCVTVASSARPGTYQVQARDISVASPVRTFKLAR
jgi:hypothetical protein